MLCHQRYSTASFHLHQSRINSTNFQPPMKNNKVHQSVVCHTVPSRLSRTNMSFPTLAFIAVFAGCLLSGNVAHAATPVLRFSFEEALGTSNLNVQSALVILTNFDAAGIPTTNLDGAAGSGVSGQLDNNRALCLTNASYVTSGGVNGPGAWETNSSDIATACGGTVPKFTVTEWFNSSILPPVNSFLGRMFILGPGLAASDINTANFIGMKWQQPNQWNVSIGTGNPTAQANFSANLPINKWLFMG